MQVHCLPQFTFPWVGELVVAGFSFSLFFRGRGRDWRGSRSFRSHIYCGFLLCCPGISLSCLGPDSIEGGLALGFGLLHLFSLESSLGFVLLSFGELSLRFGSKIGFLQIFLLLL